MQYIQYNVAAGKITRLGLYACIVLYYVTGKVWGPTNMSHCNEQEYNSIQQTDLAVKNMFPSSQTIVLALF